MCRTPWKKSGSRPNRLITSQPDSGMPKKWPGCTQTPSIEKFSDRPFIGLKRGNPQHRIPAPFHLQPPHRRLLAQLPIKFPEIGVDSIPNLALQKVTARQPSRKRPLHRSIHGEKRVGYDFQPIERRSCLGPGSHDPGRLHLRQRGNLAQPAHDKHRHSLEACRKTCRRSRVARIESVVQKDLVDDQGQIEFPAQTTSVLRLPTPS